MDARDIRTLQDAANALEGCPDTETSLRIAYRLRAMMGNGHMRPLRERETAVLRDLVESTSLLVVVEALAGICHEQRSRQTDEGAIYWARAAMALEDAITNNIG